MPHTEPVKRLVAGVMAALAVLAGSGCGRAVGGAAVPAAPGADAGFFFSGPVPVYGQTVGESDLATLAYLRALRRIDVCALIRPEALAKIGEIRSVGTLFALDECDTEIKLPGRADRRLVTVQLDLTRADRPVSFRAGDAEVYESAPGSCEFLTPLDLSRLPGAMRLRKPDQPFVRIGLIGESDCDVTRKVVGAIAAGIAGAPLPPRDAAAVYPSALAERDPCEVLPAIAGELDHWDIGRSTPYRCDFAVWRDGLPAVMSMRLSLEPKIVEVVTEGTDHRTVDGTDVYLDPTFCSAVVFVGPPMQRRLPGGDFVDVDNVVVRPAVVVDSGGGDCAPVVDVAGSAAKLYQR